MESMTMDDRICAYKTNFNIYFQNVGGMRTKAQSHFLATSHCDHDAIIVVETWLNIYFFYNEFFDTNLYPVFHKDRDSVKTRCSRGGEVLIAVRRELRCTAIRLQNEDSLLDKFCVSLSVPTETIFLTVSYIPPRRSFDLYKAHVDNIAYLYQELEDSQYICVLGDFNLSSLVWTHDVEPSAMVPSNLHLPYEILVIVELLSMGLVQINHVFNNLNKLIILIFVHPELSLNLCCSDNPLAACDAHHKPLLIVTFFSPNKSRSPLTYINSSSLDSIRSDISNIRWAEVL